MSSSFTGLHPENKVLLRARAFWKTEPNGKQVMYIEIGDPADRFTRTVRPIRQSDFDDYIAHTTEKTDVLTMRPSYWLTKLQEFKGGVPVADKEAQELLAERDAEIKELKQSLEHKDKLLVDANKIIQGHIAEIARLSSLIERDKDDVVIPHNPLSHDNQTAQINARARERRV